MFSLECLQWCIYVSIFVSVLAEFHGTQEGRNFRKTQCCPSPELMGITVKMSAKGVLFYSSDCLLFQQNHLVLKYAILYEMFNSFFIACLFITYKEGLVTNGFPRLRVILLIQDHLFNSVSFVYPQV